MPGHTEGSGAKQNNRSGVDRRAVKRSVVDRRLVRNRICGALLAVVLVGTATVYGCNSDRIAGPSVPSNASAPAVPNGDIFGATPTTETAIPGEEENACILEMVPYTGKVGYGLFGTNGGTEHLHVKFSYVFKGTGTPFGNVYHGASEYSEEVNVSPGGAEETFNHQTTMTSPTAPDFKLHYVAHVKLALDGSISASFEKGPRVDCGK